LRHLLVERALHLPDLILQDSDVALQFDYFFACSETEACADAQKESEPGQFHRVSSTKGGTDAQSVPKNQSLKY
jgi:hypothetical protein